MNSIQYSLILLLCSAGVAFSADVLQLDAETIAANAQHTDPSGRYEQQYNAEWDQRVNALIRRAGTDDAASLRQYCYTHNVSKDQLFYALHKTAGKGNCPAIKSLLMVGADINGIGEGLCDETPLMWACFCGQVEAVHLLLAHGAWVNVRNRQAETAFLKAVSDSIASITSYIQILTLLKQHGADPLVRNFLGISPLIEALSSISDYSITIAQWLVDNNAVDVEQEDAYTHSRTGAGFLNNPHIEKTAAKISWLVHNGARVNSNEGCSDLVRRAAEEFTRYHDKQHSSTPFWKQHHAESLKKDKDKLQALAQRGARLSPKAEQSVGREALAVIRQAQEQRCEAIDEVLTEQHDMPKTLAKLVCQLSDDALLQEFVMARHNTIHTECVQRGVPAVLEHTIRQFSDDELKPWAKRLLKPVH